MLRARARAMAALPLFSFVNPNLCKPFYLSFPSSDLHHRPLKSINSPKALSISSSSKPLQSPLSPIPNRDLAPYLSCSMPEKCLRIAVLLSGGVDSSVALRLLHAAGHSCTAFYLKIWFQEDFENFWSACPWDEDLKYAKEVCDQIQVPLEVVHLTDEYWNHVVSHIIAEYRCGRTPNPDVLCNTRIKFGAFMDIISSMEFDYVASGHYAHVIHSSPEQDDGSSVLELSNDTVKDQTYFLSHLSQDQLKRLLFPLGCISKLSINRSSSLVASQWMKFVGLLQKWIFLTKKGRIHKESVSWGRYVVEKDVKNNVVFVSRNYFSLDKRRRTFRVGSLKWLSGSPPGRLDQLQCKVRHGPSFYNCTIKIEPGDDGQGDVGVVQLSEDDQGLAAGQYAAFYQKRTCIGSGVILESWDDQSFPLCARALEIALMEDKSKLGPPVKIKVKPEPSQRGTDSAGSIDLLGGKSGWYRNIPDDVTESQRQTPKGMTSSLDLNWLQKLKEKLLQIF
ncbi:uncharacterized protein LOC131222525 isoform X2 [Magnolia sinica]|uniref:uncharacterized protein LOC131222525 isoform X2 n=1 Tax=Magnolia sinica TaxID=86752 RepID=UPI002657E5C5|nr:uncharacterized protein LOC131222525 isoform X2 [Magnolia sinica]